MLIARLEDSLFDQFLAAIAATEPTLKADQFGTKLLEKFALIKEQDLRAIIRVVFFLGAKMSSPHGELSAQQIAHIVLSSPLWAASKDFSQQNRGLYHNSWAIFG